MSSPVFAYSGGSGTPEDPYQIQTPTDWILLMAFSSDWNKHFILLDDINLNGISITPIGNSSIPFRGVFNGYGHNVYNVVINLPANDDVGLFGYLAYNGCIRYLGAGDLTITGRSRVGGLLAVNNGGTMIGCNSTGTVTGSQSDIGGLVAFNYWGTIQSSCSLAAVKTITSSGGGSTGGLVGYNRGTIQSCYATGSVTGHGTIGGLVGYNAGGSVIDCYATGPISSVYDAGGLVGQNRGIVITSYATGQVASMYHVGGLVGWNYAGIITSCYATGTTSGSDAVGGLVGLNNQGKVFHSYAIGQTTGGSNIGGFCGSKTTGGDYEDIGNFWDTETSLSAASAMGTGLLTAAMKTQSTFINANWDLVRTWDISDTVSYPYLRVKAGLMGTTADLNSDGRVDLIDLGLFAEQWLLGT